MYPAPRGNFTRAHGWQDGGGLYIRATGTATLTNTDMYANQAGSYGGGLSIYGTATFTNTNVYENRANRDGGGLSIEGTATLTNTNVYENQAGQVCSPFELP